MASKALDVFREQSRIKGIVNHKGDLRAAPGLVKVRYFEKSRKDEWVDRRSVDNLDDLLDRYRAQRARKRLRQLKSLLPLGSPVNMGTLALLPRVICVAVLSHLPFRSKHWHIGQLRLVSSAFCRPGADGMVLVDRAANIRLARSKSLWPLWLRSPLKPELECAVPQVKEEGRVMAGVAATATATEPVLVNALAQVKQELVARSEPRHTSASPDMSWVELGSSPMWELRFAEIVLSKETLLWTETTNFGDLDIGQDEVKGLGAAHKADFEAWKSAGTNPWHFMSPEDAIEKARPHGIFAERLQSLSCRATKLPSGGHVSSVVAATTCVCFEGDDPSKDKEGYALCGGEPMMSGMHAAEFHLIGTEEHALVGVAPPNIITTLNARDGDRGGWRSDGGDLMAAYCTGLPSRWYDDPRERGKSGDVLGILLDLDAGVLTFFLNGKLLGTALEEESVKRNVEQGQLRGPLCWCAKVWGSMGEPPCCCSFSLQLAQPTNAMFSGDRLS